MLWGFPTRVAAREESRAWGVLSVSSQQGQHHVGSGQKRSTMGHQIRKRLSLLPEFPPKGIMHWRGPAELFWCPHTWALSEGQPCYTKVPGQVSLSHQRKMVQKPVSHVFFHSSFFTSPPCNTKVKALKRDRGGVVPEAHTVPSAPREERGGRSKKENPVLLA